MDCILSAHLFLSVNWVRPNLWCVVFRAIVYTMCTKCVCSHYIFLVILFVRLFVLHCIGVFMRARSNHRENASILFFFALVCCCSVSLHFYAIHFDSISFYNLLLWKPNDVECSGNRDRHSEIKWFKWHEHVLWLNSIWIYICVCVCVCVTVCSVPSNCLNWNSLWWARAHATIFNWTGQQCVQKFYVSTFVSCIYKCSIWIYFSGIERRGMCLPDVGKKTIKITDRLLSLSVHPLKPTSPYKIFFRV